MRWKDHIATLDPMDHAALSAALVDGMDHANRAWKVAEENGEVEQILQHLDAALGHLALARASLIASLQTASATSCSS